MIQFYEILKELLKEEGLTKEELSKEIGFDINSIDETFIKGLFKIARYLDVSIDYLCGNTDNKKGSILVSHQVNTIINMILSIDDTKLKADIYKYVKYNKDIEFNKFERTLYKRKYRIKMKQKLKKISSKNESIHSR